MRSRRLICTGFLLLLAVSTVSKAVFAQGRTPDSIYFKMNEPSGTVINSSTATTAEGRPYGVFGSTGFSVTATVGGVPTNFPISPERSLDVPPMTPSTTATNRSLRFYDAFYASPADRHKGRVNVLNFNPSTYSVADTSTWSIEFLIKYTSPSGPGGPSTGAVRAICGDATGMNGKDFRIVRGGFAGIQTVNGITRTGIGMTWSGFSSALSSITFNSGGNPPGASAGISYGPSGGSYVPQGVVVWPVLKDTWTKVTLTCSATVAGTWEIRGYRSVPGPAPAPSPTQTFTAVFSSPPALSNMLSALTIGGFADQIGFDGWIDEFSIWSGPRLLPDIFTQPADEYRPNSQGQDITPPREHAFTRVHRSYAPYSMRMRLFGENPPPTGGGPAPLMTDGTSPLSLPSAMMMGTAISQGAIPVPWGGSVDIENPSVIADGFFPVTPFDLALSGDADFEIAFPLSVAGQSMAPFQVISAEPTNAPFFLTNQLPFQIYFDPGYHTVYTVGDDDYVLHQLPPGFSVTTGFGGAPLLAIGSNGMICTTGIFPGFGSAAPTMTNFFAGFSPNGSPAGGEGIAVCWADFDGSQGGDILVVDPTPAEPDTVKVVWRNQIWRNSGLPAGTFSWTYSVTQGGTPNFTIDVSGLLPRAIGVDTDPIIGVTCGSNPLFAVTPGIADDTIDFSQFVPIYHLPGSPATSIGEQFGLSGATVNPDFDRLTFYHLIPDPYRFLITIP